MLSLRAVCKQRYATTWVSMIFMIIAVHCVPEVVFMRVCFLSQR